MRTSHEGGTRLGGLGSRRGSQTGRKLSRPHCQWDLQGLTLGVEMPYYGLSDEFCTRSTVRAPIKWSSLWLLNYRS